MTAIPLILVSFILGALIPMRYVKREQYERIAVRGFEFTLIVMFALAITSLLSAYIK